MQEKHWPFNWLGLLSFNNCNVLLLLHVKKMVNDRCLLRCKKDKKKKKIKKKKKKKTPSDTYKAVNKTKKLSEKFQKNCC